MKKLVALGVFVAVFMAAGCAEKPQHSSGNSSANSDKDSWQQFRAKKAQDELDAELAKQPVAK